MRYKSLIVAPNWIGDFVMAHHLVRRLRACFPDESLHVLAPKPCDALAAAMGEVDKVIALPFAHGQLQLRARYQFAKELQGYQRAFVLPNSLKAALIPFFARIPERIGWLGEMRFGLLNRWQKISKQHPYNQAMRYSVLLDIALKRPHDSQLLPPSLQVTAGAIQHTQRALNIPNANYLVLCPGAAFGGAKRWHAQGFAGVAQRWQALGGDVLLLGSHADASACAAIMRHLDNKPHNNKTHNLAGKTSLQQAMHILAGARWAVSNDSGLMHIAAALAVPLVAIYGPTSALKTPPSGIAQKIAIVQKAQLACRPCFQRECPLKHHECMQAIDAQAVWQAAKGLNII